MEEHQINRMGILNIQVCSSGTEEEALEWVRKDSPAGTENNWVKGRFEAVTCLEHPERKHYVFDC